jgi:hypothetical protein
MTGSGGQSYRWGISRQGRQDAALLSEDRTTV